MQPAHQQFDGVAIVETCDSPGRLFRGIAMTAVIEVNDKFGTRCQERGNIIRVCLLVQYSLLFALLVQVRTVLMQRL